jgi:DNA-binding IclR family transcriptional regulator
VIKEDRSSSVAGAQLVAHTARVLRALGAAPLAGARVVDLVDATGLPRPTVHRIVRALCAEGLAMGIDDGRRYRLGPLAFELGLCAARHHRLTEVAGPSLERLAERTGDTCFLMQRSGADAVCLDRREGVYPVRALTIGVGDRRPLGAAAASLALLMHMAEDEREQYLADNAERIRRYGMLDADAVRRMLARALELGFALNCNNIIPDVSAVGVAIPARLGSPFAALSVSALTNRLMDQGRHLRIVDWLLEEAQLIAAKLWGG